MSALPAVFRHVSVLAEPRVTVVPHSAPNTSKAVSGARVNNIDGIMSFNAGLEIRIPTGRIFSR